MNSSGVLNKNIITGSCLSSSHEVALWLHNKLGSSDANWCSSQLTSQLNVNNISLIPEAFPNLAPSVKYRLLMSFLFIPKRNLQDLQEYLEVIVKLALQDEDSWIYTIAHALEQYLSHGHIPLDSLLPITPFENVAAESKSLLAAVDSSVTLLPLECPLLCKKVLNTVIGGFEPIPEKHFTLKQAPKSQIQRSDLMQKCKDIQLQSEAALANGDHKQSSRNHFFNNSSSISSLGTNGSFSAPIRNKTAPSRPKFGQSKEPNGDLLQSSMSRSSSTVKHTWNSSDSATGVNQKYKDNNKRGGAKLIEITDQPIGGSRLRKQQKLMPTQVDTKTDNQNKTIDESLSSPTKSNVAEEDKDTQSDANTAARHVVPAVSPIKKEATGFNYDQSSASLTHDQQEGANSKKQSEDQKEQIPEYMAGLQTQFSNPNTNYVPETVGSFLGSKNMPGPYKSLFPSLGHLNTPSQQQSSASTYSVQEHDYGPSKPNKSIYSPSYSPATKDSRRQSNQHASHMFKPSPQLYNSPSASAGATPRGYFSSSDDGGTNDIESGANHQTTFNFFQPTSSTNENNSSNFNKQHISSFRDSTPSPIRSIATQLQEMANQAAANPNFNQMSQLQNTAALTSPGSSFEVQSQQAKVSNVAQSSSGASNLGNNNSNTGGAEGGNRSGAGGNPNGGGRTTLDQLLSRAKLSATDRDKIDRFLRGETLADEANPQSSKVSVVLSEMRVPAEIKGELCTSVVSTVFEMDYFNKKWKVVKQTNVIKASTVNKRT